MKLNISKMLLNHKDNHIQELSFEKTGYYYNLDDTSDFTDKKSYLYIKIKKESQIIDKNDLEKQL